MLDKISACRGARRGGRRAACRGGALIAAALLFATSSPGAFAQDDGRAFGGASSSGRIEVPLSGGASARRVGNLTATPDRLATGLIQIGDSKSVTIRLEHTGANGSEPIGIGSVRIFGKDEDEYSIDFGGGVTLNPGDVQPITITFTPYTPGPKSAGVAMTIDGKTSPYVILFDGKSRFPLVSELEASDAKVDFGQIIEGKGVTKNFLLTNVGENGAPNVNVSSILIGGDLPDAYTVDFQPSSIPPGESLDVKVTMSAPVAGTKNAVAEVVHDGNNPTLEVALTGEVVEPAAVPVSFGTSQLTGLGGLNDPTSIEWGPDGKLYVSERYGKIQVYQVNRNGKDNYAANKLETIGLVAKVPNHDDDGKPNGGVNDRQVTGIHLAGTAAQPEIWVASSDPRVGGAGHGGDVNLDTNSGILHKLVKSGGAWKKTDVVRGLPRSEENHSPNGLLKQGNKIMLLVGGFTNEGMPSKNFGETSEYALSGAFLEIDLGKIGGMPYDLPTLDDEDREGAEDQNDPFGGNDGKNQAKLVEGGPVQVYTSGLRNAYDVVLTQSGRFYTFDNGPNVTWGGDPDGNCLNTIKNTGQTRPDNLNLLTQGGYVGHANPTRGNKANTFNWSNPQSPIEGPVDPRECVYKPPGQDGALTTNPKSTNGIDEYLATNFGGAMIGDLLTVDLGGNVLRIQLDGSGTKITSKSVLATVGGSPLDITATGDAGPFPGTVWIANLNGATIMVLEPADY